ncbi:protein MIZU-KUSSEI 1-like [Carex rostrata]
MRTIMSRSPHEASFSFSRRHFKWILGSKSSHGDDLSNGDFEDLDIFPFPISSSSTLPCEDNTTTSCTTEAPKQPPKKSGTKMSRLRSALVVALTGGTSRHRTGWSSLGNRVTGTLYGHRRGYVRFAIQSDPRVSPALIIELATPTCSLVKEMASGLVRIALECERKKDSSNSGTKLNEEPVWRAYCNGRKCGYAVRKEAKEEDWKVLKAVEPVSMGAGVIPGNGDEKNGDVMYMRARFERVVGSRDSEAFYMMNPDSNSGPELSVYFLRV